MQVRAVIPGVLLATVLGGALTGCGGGSKDADKPAAANTRLGTPVASATETVIDCARYSDTAQKIVEAQQELYAGKGGSTEAIETLKTEMGALKKGAPATVTAAIDELVEAFVKVQQIIANPSQADQSDLAQMGPKLAADGQTITTYIVTQCKK